MAERAMAFGTEMVEAILAGRKTQTRRPGEKRPAAVGDVMRVREAHCMAAPGTWDAPYTLNPDDPSQACYYRAGWKLQGRGRWRPSMYMPRWATRILLEVTSVRRECLSGISEADADQEGVVPAEGQAVTDAFKELWERVYPSGSAAWNGNPLVWRIEFAVIKPRRDNARLKS